jgi:hypothetical protein
MTNLKIEAILKPSDEQVKQMIKKNLFDPKTHEPENLKIAVDCDLDEVSWEEVFAVLQEVIMQDGFLSAEITKETDND